MATACRCAHQEWVVIILQWCDGVDDLLHVSLGRHLLNNWLAVLGMTRSSSSSNGSSSSTCQQRGHHRQSLSKTGWSNRLVLPHMLQQRQQVMHMTAQEALQYTVLYIQ
jgi:hypothetical protein